jgi:hypothetical protein
MKIAINRCYGGFGISEEAVMLYAKKKGLTLYGYESIYGEEGAKYKEVKSKEKPWCIHYCTKKLNLKASKEKIEEEMNSSYFTQETSKEMIQF